jgi:hypothetical protein
LHAAEELARLHRDLGEPKGDGVVIVEPHAPFMPVLPESVDCIERGRLVPDALSSLRAIDVIVSKTLRTMA